MEFSRFPLELIHQIIDHSSDDKDVLKSLALTASGLVFYAQSYLFRRVDLDFGNCCIDKDIKACESFDEILRHSPIVGSYVRELVIGQIFHPGDLHVDSFGSALREILCPHHADGSPPHVLTQTSLEDWFTRKVALISSTLPLLPNVSHLALNRHPESTIRWDDMPSPIRHAMTMFISQTSLKSLSLYFVTFTPISVFASILQKSDLTTLKLEETTLSRQISTAELASSLTSSSLNKLQTLVLITARPREYNMFYIGSLILNAAAESLRHFTWFTRNSPGDAVLDPLDLSVLTKIQTLTLSWDPTSFSASIRAPLLQIVTSGRTTVTVIELVHHGQLLTDAQRHHFKELEDVLQESAFSALLEIRFIFIEVAYSVFICRSEYPSPTMPEKVERQNDMIPDFPTLAARGVIIKAI